MTSPSSGQPQQIQIQIRHPERFWFAVSTEMPGLVDPDTRDGKPRHADRDTIRWGVVGELVQELGEILARQDFKVHEDADGAVYDLYVVDRFGLTAAEQNIVSSWFTDYEAPRSDPWHDSLDNGRHRLWGAWQCTPDLVLPVLSDLLLWEDSIDDAGEEFRLQVCLSAKIGLLKLALDAPVRDRSVQFIERLERLGAQAPTTSEAADQIEMELLQSGHLGSDSLDSDPRDTGDQHQGFWRRLTRFWS